MIRQLVKLVLSYAIAWLLIAAWRAWSAWRRFGDYPPVARGDAPADEYGIRTIPLSSAEWAVWGIAPTDPTGLSFPVQLRAGGPDLNRADPLERP